MTNNIMSNFVIASGIVIMALGFILEVHYNNLDEEGIREAKLAEERYMMEHYGYRYNMEDYLDYLKNNDIDAFMKLKPVWEDMQYESDNSSPLISFPIMVGGFFITMIGIFLRK